MKDKSEDRTPLKEKVPVLTISSKLLAWAPSPVEPMLETIEEAKRRFVLSIPEVCEMAGITDNDKAEILTCSKFRKAQSTDSDYCAASPLVVRPNSWLNVDNDGFLSEFLF